MLASHSVIVINKQVHTDLCIHGPQVTVETANGAVCVGVAQKPLSNRRVGSSNQFWALESHTGRLYHEGESNELGPTLSEGDRCES